MPDADPRAKYATELVSKFPNTSKRELAKLLYAEFPQGFNSLDTARCMIRRRLGALGKEKRKHLNIEKPIQRERAKPMKIPEPKEHWDEEWEPYQLRARRVLVLSDIHLPYHDKRALELALSTGKEHKVDAVLFNGDLMDFYAVSRWQKDPRRRDFAAEIEMGREFLAEVRREFSGCQIVWKLGNHEERWEAFMYQKAPEIVGVEDFEIQSFMRCKQHKVRVVRDMRPVRINRLNILHGHEYRFSITNPVNPARGIYLRAKTSAMVGHLHQTSEHTESNLNGKIETCWSMGCLCNLRPSYSPLNKWNHGFAIVDTTGEDDYSVLNHRIHKSRLL